MDAARQYAPSGRLGDLFPWVLFGIGSRETEWGLSKWYVDIDGIEDDDPGDGVGDNGHGRGLMQIDDRWHEAFVRSGEWKDPDKNIEKSAEILRQSHDYLKRKGVSDDALVSCSIAGYNAGPGRVWQGLSRGMGPDHYTTGKNYSEDVLRRAEWWLWHFATFSLIQRPVASVPTLKERDLPIRPFSASLSQDGAL
jgi:hypothetical protein